MINIQDIQFRAYDIKQKKWLCNFDKFGGFHLIGEFVLFGQWDNVISPYIFEKDGLHLNDIEVTCFTGFRDKNSNAIFEGDYLDVKLAYYKESVKMEVKPIDNVMTLCSLKAPYESLLLTSFTANASVICGNKYDNN